MNSRARNFSVILRYACFKCSDYLKMLAHPIKCFNWDVEKFCFLRLVSGLESPNLGTSLINRRICVHICVHLLCQTSPWPGQFFSHWKHPHILNQPAWDLTLVLWIKTVQVGTKSPWLSRWIHLPAKTVFQFNLLSCTFYLSGYVL